METGLIQQNSDRQNEQQSSRKSFSDEAVQRQLNFELQQFPREYALQVFGKYQDALPIEKAAEVDSPALCTITKKYGREATKFWLRYHIAQTLAIIGVFDQVEAGQVRAVADDILNDSIYGQFTCSEFLSFLSRFRMGKYGKIYSTNKPNLQEFLMALQPFWKDLQTERARVMQEKQSEEREREYEERQKGKCTYAEYMRMKEQGLIDKFLVKK